MTTATHLQFNSSMSFPDVKFQASEKVVIRTRETAASRDHKVTRQYVRLVGPPGQIWDVILNIEINNDGNE